MKRLPLRNSELRTPPEPKLDPFKVWIEQVCLYAGRDRFTLTDWFSLAITYQSGLSPSEGAQVLGD
jgi:hypothetical protein